MAHDRFLGMGATADPVSETDVRAVASDRKTVGHLVKFAKRHNDQQTGKSYKDWSFYASSTAVQEASALSAFSCVRLALASSLLQMPASHRCMFTCDPVQPLRLLQDPEFRPFHLVSFCNISCIKDCCCCWTGDAFESRVFNADIEEVEINQRDWSKISHVANF